MMRTLAVWMLLVAAAVAQSPQTVEIKVRGAGGSGVLCGGTPDGQLRIVLTVHHVVGR